MAPMNAPFPPPIMPIFSFEFMSLSIDFVVNKGRKKYYIQSVLSLGDARKEKTELRPLLGVRDFFRKIIVTKSGMKPWIDEEGILHLGLYEFLNPDAMDL